MYNSTSIHLSDQERGRDEGQATEDEAMRKDVAGQGTDGAEKETSGWAAGMAYSVQGMAHGAGMGTPWLGRALEA
jgi:hypothetical protein